MSTTDQRYTLIFDNYDYELQISVSIEGRGTVGFCRCLCVALVIGQKAEKLAGFGGKIEKADATLF
jgi:hypothetical protein